MAESKLTAERVRELFDYEPLTGVLTRRVATNRWPAGAEVGTRASRGHINVIAAKRRMHDGCTI